MTDAPYPAGVDVTVGAGTGKATFDVCGIATLGDAGSEATLTCGSVIVQVTTGAAQVVVGGGSTVVSVPQGGKAEVSGSDSTGFTVENLGSTDVGVTVDGVQATVAPGQTSSVAGDDWTFQGFSPPVAALPALNAAKAGSTVPFKWRLLGATGAPVTNLLLADLTVTARSCTTAATTGPPQTTSILGGLQNLGHGYYQLNWKTPKGFAGTCQTTHLDIGAGVTHDAAFRFKS